jgi:hypothetical protein
VWGARINAASLYMSAPHTQSLETGSWMLMALSDLKKDGDF